MNIRTEIATAAALVWMMFVSFSAVSQKPEDVALLRQKYTGQNGVIMQSSDKISFTLKNGKPLISSRLSRTTAFFSDNARYYSSGSIWCSPLVGISDIEAYSLLPDGKSYQKKSVTEFRKSGITDRDIFFDDTEKISFYFPGLKDNSLSILNYTKTYTDPHLFSTVHIGSYLPVDKSEIEISADPGMEVFWKLINCDSVHVTVNEFSRGNKKIIRIRAENIRTSDYETAAPPYLYRAPHLILYLKSYTYKGKIYEVLGTPSRLYQWAYGFVDSVVHTPSPRVGRLSDSLTAGSSNIRDRISLLYRWVQDNIRYVAYEEGYYGFIPRQPELVLTRRFGDCKDMSVLLHTMLKSCGIRSGIAWTGTRDLPYDISEIPVPAALNHLVVVAWDEEGTKYILDPTASSLGMEAPSSGIQGKELLVSIDRETFELIRAPVMDKDWTSSHGEFSIGIEPGGKISGSGKMEFGGYIGLIIRSEFSGAGEKQKSDEMISLAASGNKKFSISNLHHSNAELRDENLSCDFGFELPDYFHSDKDKIYINMNLSKNLLTLIDMKDRHNGIISEFRYTLHDEYVLQLPEGHRVSFIPANDRHEGSEYAYRFEYKQQDNCVILDRTVSINYLQLPLSELRNWNDFVRKFNANVSMSVVLEKQP